MLLDCFASCTACLSPRWERRAADRGQDPASVPVPVPIPAEAPAADDANGLEPPFKINLSFFTSTGTAETINVTVDHSVPVNVVTNKCLKKLGFKPFPHALPPDLSKLAAKALPGHCGWQKLNFYATRGLSRNIDFVIVGDDYRCDLLLGREFKGVQFKPGVGIYPNLLNPKSKGKLAPRLTPCIIRFGENSRACVLTTIFSCRRKGDTGKTEEGKAGTRSSIGSRAETAVRREA
jgi:hypothetical protein